MTNVVRSKTMLGCWLLARDHRKIEKKEKRGEGEREVREHGNVSETGWTDADSMQMGGRRRRQGERA